ncbi:sulfotransferase family 2 domain-containing protein [Thioalkalivibrio sp. ALE11]|uniref:sulfotransferase family 2 domain-containing protein n=1 Tax=Thioalkalivibrio sp. ALE11 TaxID=1265494 RepID=UPI000475B801|nr:sulfotransferase family 2 domain-containing protein [Thioalkalivibrio sp. ALE11]
MTKSHNPAVFVVHIPKTAGTSLRKAAERYLSSGRVEYDYGSESDDTTPRVLRHVYEDGDHFALMEDMEAAGAELLVGHVPLAKYLPLFGVSRCLSMVRDPAGRLVSEFNHLTRSKGLDTPFEDFLRRPNQLNRQTRLLAAVPPEAMGFVGLTERYADSVRVLNKTFGWKLRCLDLNRAPSDRLREEDLGPEVMAEIRERHARDVRLHERVQRLLRDRVELMDAGHAFVHGLVESANQKSVRGWAWYEPRHQDTAVELELLQGGDVVATTAAVQPRPDLASWFLPRRGYVGFEFAATGTTDLQVRVRGTGQVLAFGAGDDGVPPREVSGRIEHADPGAGAEPEFLGWVDRADRFSVVGWAVAPRNPAQTVNVRLLLDGQLVGRARCDEFRPDVLEAGKHPTGACGFTFEWPRSAVRQQLREVEVRIEADEMYRFATEVRV